MSPGCGQAAAAHMQPHACMQATARHGACSQMMLSLCKARVLRDSLSRATGVWSPSSRSGSRRARPQRPAAARMRPCMHASALAQVTGPVHQGVCACMPCERVAHLNLHAPHAELGRKPEGAWHLTGTGLMAANSCHQRTGDRTCA